MKKINVTIDIHLEFSIEIIGSYLSLSPTVFLRAFV